MLIVTAPTALDHVPVGGRRLFLAGGITECPDWQAEICEMLEDTALVLLNPRRPEFPIGDPACAEAQIRWEYMHLRMADAISFWFPAESLCPIVLYELGAWSMASKPIFVGRAPGYRRWQDVDIQTELVRPEVRVTDDLADLAEQVKTWEMEP